MTRVQQVKSRATEAAEASNLLSEFCSEFLGAKLPTVAGLLCHSKLHIRTVACCFSSYEISALASGI
jgi:hypothetical protein